MWNIGTVLDDWVKMCDYAGLHNLWEMESMQTNSLCAELFRVRMKRSKGVHCGVTNTIATVPVYRLSNSHRVQAMAVFVLFVYFPTVSKLSPPLVSNTVGLTTASLSQQVLAWYFWPSLGQNTVCFKQSEIVLVFSKSNNSGSGQYPSRWLPDCIFHNVLVG